MKQKLAELNNWTEIFLGDEKYFQLATGGTPSTEKKEYWEDGTIPWLSSGEVHKKVVRQADGRITEKGFRNSNARFYPVNSTLIALAGQGKTRGTVAITEIEVTSNQSIAAIIPDERLIEPRYLYYNLDSRYEELRAISAGAGRAGLSLSILANVSLKLPRKDEQEKIAIILSRIDQAIEQTEALIAKQQRIKAGLMHDLLTKGIDEHGNIRSEATHEFKDSPLGRIPVEWDTPQIEDKLAKIIDYRGKTPNKADHGIPLITAKIIRLGYLLEPDEFIPPETYAKWMTRGLPAKDDVLFTTEAPLGNVAQITNSKVALGQRVLTLQSEPDLKSDFLFYLLLYPSVRAQFDRASSGSTVTGIKQSQFRLIRILLPQTIEEQERIVEILKTQDLCVQQESVNLSKLRALKTGLMQDLLTGKIPVTPLLETQPQYTQA
ncbi:MAG: restriction endonuclease subunit S [Blastocatellia bacterium]|nr:restriction endonuclease subunit S [Blastocatellia bacterium]